MKEEAARQVKLDPVLCPAPLAFFTRVNVTLSGTSRHHLHLASVTQVSVPRSGQEHTHRSHSHPTLFTLEVLEAIWRRDPTSHRPREEDRGPPDPPPSPFNTPQWRF
ncbi:hypothetical protein E2C01_020632 [Portunus trituberculatus]|uniref:Uncharacterized protein n=1 Tax=Portunus trituberculatus TaxID=210409 RepID=A0A5B7E2L3_PORTR|nr:hypothetical protein [Portunus trituberculatus]